MIQYYAMPGLKYREHVPARPDKIENAINEICKYFNIDPSLLMVRTRKVKVVDVRTIAIHFLRIRLHLPLRVIAERFNMDHTTVMWGVKRCKNLMETDPIFMNRVQDINNLI